MYAVEVSKGQTEPAAQLRDTCPTRHAVLLRPSSFLKTFSASSCATAVAGRMRGSAVHSHRANKAWGKVFADWPHDYQSKRLPPSIWVIHGAWRMRKIGAPSRPPRRKLFFPYISHNFFFLVPWQLLHHQPSDRHLAWHPSRPSLLHPVMASSSYHE